MQALLRAFILGLIALGWFQGIQSTAEDSVQRALLLNRNQVTQVVLPKLHSVFLQDRQLLEDSTALLVCSTFCFLYCFKYHPTIKYSSLLLLLHHKNK